MTRPEKTRVKNEAGYLFHKGKKKKKRKGMDVTSVEEERDPVLERR